VLPAPCHIVSDVHLGAAPATVESQLLGFLRALRTAGGSLVINGDLFDFWFEWKSVVPRTGVRVIAALAELREAGMPVLWLAGNHDCWGGDVLRDDYGIEYRLDPWEGTLAGWRARVDHGDGLRPKEDRGYRALRRVIRHPWAIRAFRALHPDLGSRLATGSSHASRTYMPGDGDAGLRGIAHAELARRADLELLVYGHSHVRRLERVASGGVYANPGTWMEAPTYLRVTPERIELRRWDGSAEGERLDVVDRLAEKALAQA
jgi:UDP-2,3-diacylglucosamine hydrolase